jgi:single-stranded-DNA-specific exonuclease
MTRDRGRGQGLAKALATANQQRQDEEDRVVLEARERLLGKDRRDPLAPLLVAWSEDWHRGVVGIAAGRLARELHRPTIILSVDGETATGSGRSVEGVDLHSFISRWAEELERFGGHAKAIGLTATTTRLAGLAERWRLAAAEWPPSLLQSRFEYELELGPKEIGLDLLEELAQLEPHGEGNPRPLVKVGPLRLAFPPRTFGRDHLRVVARGEDGSRVQLLGWGWKERQAELAGAFEVLGHLELDRYSGGAVLRLIDCRGVAEPS